MDAPSITKNENQNQMSEEKLGAKAYYSILFFLLLEFSFSAGMLLIVLIFLNPAVNPLHPLFLRIFSLTAIGLSVFSIVLYLAPLFAHIFSKRRKSFTTNDIFTEILDKQANASTSFYKFRTNSIVFAVLLSFVLVISSVIYSIVLSFL